MARTSEPLPYKKLGLSDETLEHFLDKGPTGKWLEGYWKLTDRPKEKFDAMKDELLKRLVQIQQTINAMPDLKPRGLRVNAARVALQLLDAARRGRAQTVTPYSCAIYASTYVLFKRALLSVSPLSFYKMRFTRETFDKVAYRRLLKTLPCEKNTLHDFLASALEDWTARDIDSPSIQIIKENMDDVISAFGPGGEGFTRFGGDCQPLRVTVTTSIDAGVVVYAIWRQHKAEMEIKPKFIAAEFGTTPDVLRLKAETLGMLRALGHVDHPRRARRGALPEPRTGTAKAPAKGFPAEMESIGRVGYALLLAGSPHAKLLECPFADWSSRDKRLVLSMRHEIGRFPLAKGSLESLLAIIGDVLFGEYAAAKVSDTPRQVARRIRKHRLCSSRFAELIRLAVYTPAPFGKKSDVLRYAEDRIAPLIEAYVGSGLIGREPSNGYTLFMQALDRVGKHFDSLK